MRDIVRRQRRSTTALRAGTLLFLLVTSSCAAKVSGDLQSLCERTAEIENRHQNSLRDVTSESALNFVYEYLYVVDLACGRISK